MDYYTISDNSIKLVIEEYPKYFRLFVEEERSRLISLAKKFIETKKFEGCQGLEVTERMRIIVGLLACQLLIGHRAPKLFPTVCTVLLYPSAFYDKPVGQSNDTIKEKMLGKAFKKDFVILSWPSVLHSIQDSIDGHNLVLHEFAHQLDILDGRYDGLLPMKDARVALAWEREMNRQFLKLQRQIIKGKKTFFDQYAATNNAEFFAVATEQFFEQPQQFYKSSKKLYELFRFFYQQDPKARLSDGYCPPEYYSMPHFIFSESSIDAFSKLYIKEVAMRRFLIIILVLNFIFSIVALRYPVALLFICLILLNLSFALRKYSKTR